MEPVNPDTPRYRRLVEIKDLPDLPPILEDSEEKEMEWAEQMARLELRAKQESAARASDERLRKALIREELDAKAQRRQQIIKRNRARSA